MGTSTPDHSDGSHSDDRRLAALSFDHADLDTLATVRAVLRAGDLDVLPLHGYLEVRSREWAVARWDEWCAGCHRDLHPVPDGLTDADLPDGYTTADLAEGPA